MKAIDTLMHEHRLIEKVLVGFETYLDGVEQGNDAPIEDLGKFATFIREFADRCHHGKEEDILFESMVAHGFPKDAGPVGVMLMEHTEGRAHARALAEASKETAWNPELRKLVVEHGRGYIALLRAHIQKEDTILYPMAEQNLPAERMEKMADEFDDFEANIMGKGVHEQYHKLAEELITHYSGDAAHQPSADHHHDHEHA